MRAARGLRWRPVGRVNAAWVPHGNHTQRLKRLKRLERRRNVMCVQNALNGRRRGRTHISRAQTMMHSERHARSDRWHGEYGNSANEVCI
jgi:hypothetical protein